MSVAAHLRQFMKFQIRVVLIASLQGCAQLGKQKWCPNWLLKPVMIVSLRLYRGTLSHLVGRDCLFTPTCSQRALAALRAMPFLEAIQEAMEQVAGCNPNYALRSDGAGWVLVTSNGRVYCQSDFSPGLERKLAELPSMQAVGLANACRTASFRAHD
jgi:putative membrane protein insertion efficiency factor